MTPNSLGEALISSETALTEVKMVGTTHRPHSASLTLGLQSAGQVTATKAESTGLDGGVEDLTSTLSW